MKNFYVILLFICSFCYSQKRAKDNIDADVINSIIQFVEKPYWVNKSNILHGFKLNEKEIEKIHLYYNRQPTSKEKVYINLFLGAYNYTVTENFPKAEHFFLYCYENSTFLSVDQKFALYNSLADVEKIQNNYINSIFFYETNLKLAIDTKNKLEECNSYREVGVIYRDINQFDLAETFLLKSQKILKENNFKKDDEVWNFLHLARLYRLRKEYGKSKEFYEAAIKLAQQNALTVILKNVYLDYAEYWIDTKNLEKAKFYCQKLIDNKDDLSENNTEFIKLVSFNLLGKISLAEKDTLNAIKYSEKSFEISKKTGAFNIARESAERIVNCTDKSSHLHKDMISFIIASYNKQDEFFTRYKVYAKQLDDLNNLENKLKLIDEKTHIQNISITIILSVLIILLILFFILRKNKENINFQTKKLLKINEKIQRNNAKLAQINEDLNQFSSVVSHDIKSAIVGLQYSIKKIKESNTKENEFSKIIILENEINNLYEYVDYLMFASKNASVSNLLPQEIDFQEILLQIENTFQGKTPFTLKFIYSEDYPEFKGYKIQIFQLFKALTEIAINNNSIHKQLEIKINIVKNSKEILEIIFFDNGPIMEESELEYINHEIQNINEISLKNNIGINYLVCQKIISNYSGTFKIISNSQKGNLKCIVLLEK